MPSKRAKKVRSGKYIVRELAIKDAPAYHRMARIRFVDCTVALRDIEADITSRQIFLRCFASLAVIFGKWLASKQTRWLRKRVGERSQCACAHHTFWLRLAKRTNFTHPTWERKKCWTVVDRIFDSVSNMFQHDPTTPNLLYGHQTWWPNDKMLIHPTCRTVQRLLLGQALTDNAKWTYNNKQDEYLHTNSLSVFIQVAIKKIFTH